jgi:hypothetical protein
MIEECLNHDNFMPVEHLMKLQGEYKPANSEELYDIALEETRKSRGVYRFQNYKFILKKN